MLSQIVALIAIQVAIIQVNLQVANVSVKILSSILQMIILVQKIVQPELKKKIILIKLDAFVMKILYLKPEVNVLNVLQVKEKSSAVVKKLGLVMTVHLKQQMHFSYLYSLYY